MGRGPDPLAAWAAAVDRSGVDRVWVGDHVSFRDGRGSDGLLATTALATVTRRVTIQTAVYLLPLRHPVLVARQVAGIAELAPGRFVFGVGIGGEDPREVRNCGIDPSERGARMDESLPLVRRLLAGERVDHAGPRFALDAASIVPTPDPAVPIVVGGRSDAALRRTARHADGWLGVWVTPERFAANVATVAAEAEQLGRRVTEWQHGLLAWCGVGASREAARPVLAGAMESFYGVAFERFEPSSPYGTPDDVAEALAPYVAAGASSILLSPIATDPEAGLAAVARVRELLRR
jgi:alkanesulfonate monooxygenase SsuD/methylene tetrahydromethanopterin reductase-like flavin-dependent oxidoreductase (luciferase family)